MTRVRAAARDVSFYRSGGRSRSAWALHVVREDGPNAGHVSACGIPILHDQTFDASEVVPRNRCRRSGCATRWPAGIDRSTNDEGTNE